MISTWQEYSKRSNRQSMLLSIVVAFALLVGEPALGQPFPASPLVDSFPSTAVFRVTLTPSLGGTSFTVTVSDDGSNTRVLRSAPHFQDSPADVVGTTLGDGTSGCLVDPRFGVSDTDIGYKPAPFDAMNPLRDEVHTEMCTMTLTGGGYTVRVGDAAEPGKPRSYGEVESRAPGGTGFPAESLFNLFLDIDVPAGAIGPGSPAATLYNLAPLLVSQVINSFPPNLGDGYVHRFFLSVGWTRLYNRADDCYVGYIGQGTHRAGPAPTDPPPPPVPMRFPPVRYPFVLSLTSMAEGLLVPDVCVLPPNPQPNDVYALGLAGPAIPNPPGYFTEGELFQSSGRFLGAGPDMTNVDRMSAALGIGPTPVPPPYMGPFAPNTLPVPAPLPAPPPRAGSSDRSG